MTIGHENLEVHNQNLSASSAASDDGVVVPGSPPPLGNERTDVNPSDEAGVDELPDNNGVTPQDSGDNAWESGTVPDIDLDNAERDGVPDPR